MITGDQHSVNFGEETYASYLSTNKEFNTNVLRYNYSSLITPWSTYDYNMDTKEKKLIKETKVLGDFDKENYTSERIYADARDGKKVPISLVYKKDLKTENAQNLLLYGYGSYGSTSDPYFSLSRISLLDRGFVFAIAHIRGSQVYGRQSYEDGKLLNKKNTFYDFIDAGKYLIKNEYTSSDQLFCGGGSAGGLLIGAVINMEQDL